MAQPLWKTSLAVSNKVKHMPTNDPAVPLHGIYSQRVENLHSHKNLHTSVYSSKICNCQKLETTQTSFK